MRLSTEMTRIVKRDKSGVAVRIKNRTPVPDGHNPVDGDPTASDDWEEEYDEIVLCVL